VWGGGGDGGGQTGPRHRAPYSTPVKRRLLIARTRHYPCLLLPLVCMGVRTGASARGRLVGGFISLPGDPLHPVS